jgi:hypothetical protein
LCGYPSNFIEEHEANLEGTEVEPQTVLTCAIDFGCAVPFTEIPLPIEEGFEASWKLFTHRNPKVLAHYEAACGCLEQCIGEPLCDVLLMIVLTFSSSIVTPALPMNGSEFEVGPRKDPRLVAVTCQGNARPICPALGRLASGNIYIISPSLTLLFPLYSQFSLYYNKPTLIVYIL